MMRLKSRLLADNAKKTAPTKVFSPANTEVLRIPFRKEKTAKVVGRLANEIPPPATKSEFTNGENDELELDEKQQARLISGVLVQNDFKLSLMAPEDLREYAGLTTTTLTCRQRLTLSAAGVDLIKWALEGTFGAVNDVSTNPKTEEGINGDVEMNGNGHTKEEDADEEIDRSVTSFEVMGCVKVHVEAGGKIEVEWEGNMMNDAVADAVLAVLFTVESSPAAVKRESPTNGPICRDIDSSVQNPPSTVITITIRTSPSFITLMLGLTLVSASPGYACSLKHSLGPKSRR